ncbi:MAG TPA: hypothetical protein VFV38_15215 [Ktedonobacteraceae bacterium]|nr:hypothetical protein [Ktedonobacteraceae bacterium]
MQRQKKPIEKIFLETRPPECVALSIGGCGILTRALVGRHAMRYRESQSIALAFAHVVVQALGFSPSSERLSTPQILVDAADAVIDDPEHVFLLGTAWRYQPEGVEICSVGSNSVLVFEQDTVREVIVPHTINELLKRRGQEPEPKSRMQVTHVLGSKRGQESCHTNDVRVALIPWLPTTMIAVIEERLLADAILEGTIPRNQLSSYIEMWEPPQRKTSILISW